MPPPAETLRSLLQALDLSPREVAACVARFEQWAEAGDPRGEDAQAAIAALGAVAADTASDVSLPHADEAPTLPQVNVPEAPDAEPASRSAPPLRRPILDAGERVDQYEIIRPLGRGGMGSVYLARDVLLGRKVALKVVHPHLVGAQDAVERFLFEARATARFSHPHIVAIYGLGQVHGCPYVALEYLEGGTLRDRLREGPLSAGETATLLRRVAQALQEAHRQSVLHCDLKPENILLPRDGRLRVVDFGLARLLGAGPLASAAATVDGARDTDTAAPEAGGPDPTRGSRAGAAPGGGSAVRGTVAYMAPEQWLGEPLGPAVDVWAFGVVLHEALTGERPFKGSAVRLYQQVTARDLRPPTPTRADAPVPEPLAALCQACLARDPGDRPRAQEIVQRLSALLPSAPETLFADPQEGTQEDLLTASPFRGLAPFRRAHASWFYGREAESEAAVERLRRSPMLAVVGASGAGKSSFVQAGILPRLESLARWDALVVRPGHQPFDALAHRLLGQEASDSREPAAPPATDREARRDLAERLSEEPTLLGQTLRARARERSASMLLVVDQLEEIFTLCPSPQARARFCQAILFAADDAASPVRVIVTLREDFLSRLARYPELIAEMSRGIVVVRTPGPEALTEILQAPLARLGYRFDDDRLVREMVREVEQEPAGLPLLQFAATRLWEGRDRETRQIQRATYASIGGVAGALAAHADAVLDGLVGDALRAAREILVRLVTPDGTRTARRQTDLLAEVGAGGSEALERLVNARLLVPRRGTTTSPDETEVELIHESLTTRWERLRRWLEESREEVVLRSELEGAVAKWRRGDRRDEDLWQGRALAEALEYRARHAASLPADVAAFLERSERFSRRQATRRAQVRAAVIAGVVLLGAAVFTLLWIRAQERRARKARQEAVVARSQARVRMASALLEGAESAFLRGDYHDARAKLRASFEVADSTRARALFAALEASAMRFRANHPESVFSVALSPDGRHVASGCYDGTIRVWDRETGAVRVLRGHRKEVFGLDYSPDGTLLVSGAGDGDVRLWRLAEGRGRVVMTHLDRVFAVAFGPHGNQLASAAGDGAIKVLRIGKKAPLRLRGHQGRVTAIRFGPEGKRLVSAGADGTVRVWDLQDASVTRLEPTGAPLAALDLAPSGRKAITGDAHGEIRLWRLDRLTSRPLARIPNPISAIAWNPAADRFCVGDDRGTIRIWSGRDKRFRVLGAHRDRVSSLVYGARGAVLASGSYDRSLAVWDPEVRPTPSPSGHSGWVSGVAFRPDGRELASASQDQTVRLWDIASGASRVLTGHTGRVMAVAYRPDGRQLASAGFDHTIRLWDPSGTTRRVLRGHTAPIYAIAYRPPDGQQLASASADRTLRLWTLATGRSKQLRGHTDRVFGVAFSPDGRRLASASWDRTVRIWDARTGQPLQVLRGHHGRVSCVAWSPTGERIATGSYDRTVRVWNLRTGGAATLRGHGDYVWGVAFSRDGRFLASASRDRTVRLWEISTGRALRVLRGHTRDVNRVAFSPDGALLATGSDDTTVRLWELPWGRLRWRANALLPGAAAASVSGRPPDRRAASVLGPRTSPRSPSPVQERRLDEARALSGAPARLVTGRGPIPLDHFGERLGSSPHPADRAEAVLLTALSNARGRAERGPRGRLLAFVGPGDAVELWSLPKMRRLWRRAVPGVVQAVPLDSNTVLSVARGSALRVSPTATAPLIQHGAQRLVVAPSHLIVLTREGAHVLDRSGRPLHVHQVAPGATSAIPTRDGLLVGYRDGTVESLEHAPSAAPPHRPLDGVPAVPVTALSPGPLGTLGVGFQNGAVGLWDLRTGKRLASRRLHGAIRYLLPWRHRLYAATELGDTAQIDLSVFNASACEILRRIWARYPSTWDRGRALRRPPPPLHPCARRHRLHSTGHIASPR